MDSSPAPRCRCNCGPQWLQCVHEMQHFTTALQQQRYGRPASTNRVWPETSVGHKGRHLAACKPAAGRCYVLHLTILTDIALPTLLLDHQQQAGASCVPRAMTAARMTLRRDHPLSAAWQRGSRTVVLCRVKHDVRHFARLTASPSVLVHHARHPRLTVRKRLLFCAAASRSAPAACHAWR